MMQMMFSAGASSLYTFTTFTFTPGTATGRNGPSLATLLASYNTVTNPWLNNSAYFNAVGGIQYWTVPLTGTYTIECVGAAGGGSSTTPGYGARMIGNFSLTQGDTIKILVGQKGLNGTNGCGSGVGGGGGGSFVTTNLNAAYIVAGGGGGSSSRVISSTQLNGTTSTSGNQGDGVNGGFGGSSGSGGSGGGGCTSGGSGGGGLTGNGSGSDGAGGASFTSGGVGGALNGEGGFGGGAGGGTYGGGGAGGYSGGGGGGLNTCSCSDLNGGGGGGSFNAGTSQSNTSGFNTGTGYVTITFVS